MAFRSRPLSRASSPFPFLDAQPRHCRDRGDDLPASPRQRGPGRAQDPTGLEDVIVVPSDGTKIVAVQRTDLDLEADPRAKELAIADNRAGQVSLEWDADVLKELDSEINLEQFWSPQELEKLLGKTVHFGDAAEPQIDKAEELREKWQTARGQVWEIPSKSIRDKAHRLACGDSGSESDVTALFDGHVAALMATDPPYGVAYAVESGADSAKRFTAMTGDESDGAKLQQFLEQVFRVAIQHLREDAAWYLWHAQMTQGFFAAAAAAAAAQLLIHRQIIWVKNHFILGHGDYHWQHELCFYGWREGHRAKWLAGRNQSTIWNIDRPSAADAHPTQKPVELFTRPMENHTERGEICYEPFSGSGTQFCAAELAGRVCYGMEIEPKYVAVALERLHQMGLKPCLVTEVPLNVSSTGSQSDSTTKNTTKVDGKTAKKKAAAKREKH